MPAIADTRPPSDLRVIAVLTGLLMLTGAAVAGLFAREHMMLLNSICGSSQHAHCGWCIAALGLAAVGAPLLLHGLRPAERG